MLRDSQHHEATRCRRIAADAFARATGDSLDRGHVREEAALSRRMLEKAHRIETALGIFHPSRLP